MRGWQKVLYASMCTKTRGGCHWLNYQCRAETQHERQVADVVHGKFISPVPEDPENRTLLSLFPSPQEQKNLTPLV